MTITVVAGVFDRLQDAIFDPLPLRDALDLARFTGRTGLIAAIDREIAARRKGYIVVRGEAGVGKSALAAHLAFARPCVHHFTRIEGARSPEQARRSLAAQLIGQWQLTDLAPGDALPASASRPDWLLKVIRAAAAKRDAEGQAQPLVLVVDGLDEADPPAPGQDTGIPLGLPRPESLPDGVFVVATSRFGIPLTAVRGPVDWHTIDVNSDENRTDMRTYLDTAVREPDLARRLTEHNVSPAAFADQLAGRCAGIWMYLRYVLDDLRAGRSSPTSVDALPENLSAYYLEHLDRWATRPSWFTAGLPVLATLAALRRPAVRAEVAQLADVPAHEVGVWLDGDLRPFLDQHHDDSRLTYAVRHQSLRDLFRPALDSLGAATRETLHDALSDAHRRIAATLIPNSTPSLADWQNADRYLRDALPEHAGAAGLLDDLVLDPGFLLTVDPAALLRHATDLTTVDGRAAVAAFELTVDRWPGLPSEDRLRWLHVWARKTRCTPLADRAAGPGWTVVAAMWTGAAHRTFTHHTGTVRAVCAVPMPEGQALLASGGHDGTIWLWDPVTGAGSDRPFAAGVGRVTALCALRTPTSVLLAAVCDDHAVRIWHVADGGHVGALLGTGSTQLVTALCAVALPDGRTLLVTGTANHTVCLWDPETGQTVGAPLLGHTGTVDVVCTVPMADGRVLVASADHETVRLWDPTTGQEVAALTNHDVPPVRNMCTVRAPDGRTLLAIGTVDTIRLWDPVTGDQDIVHVSGQAMCAMPSADDGTALACGDWDGNLMLIDPGTGDPIHHPLTDHTGRILALCALPTPEGRHVLVSGSADHTVRLYDRYAERGDAGPAGPVRALCAVRDRAGAVMLVSASADIVRRWAPITGQHVGEPIYSYSRAEALCLVPYPGGQPMLATAGRSSVVRLCDVNTGEPLVQIDNGSEVLAICAVPVSGHWVLVCAADDGTVTLWDPRQTRRPVARFDDHVRTVRPVGTLPLPNGAAQVAACGVDRPTRTVRVWDPVAEENVALLHADATALCQVPIDDRMVLAVAEKSRVRLWDPNSDEVVTDIYCHSHDPLTVCTLPTPDGATLMVTGGGDGVVRLWDPGTGHPVGQPLTGHTAAVRALCVLAMPDGTTLLASGGDDNTILIHRPT